MEPIQGEGGFIEPARGFLPAISAWCRENGVVFVADEVQTGFCRTGSWFASTDEDVVPGPDRDGQGHRGRPAARPRSPAAPNCWTPSHPGGLGGTYGGNPVACAAALGSIETMKAEDLAASAKRHRRSSCRVCGRWPPKPA